MRTLNNIFAFVSSGLAVIGMTLAVINLFCGNWMLAFNCFASAGFMMLQYEWNEARRLKQNSRNANARDWNHYVSRVVRN